MKRLRSHNILSGAANFKVPAGQYSAFLLRAAGTNQAGQTLTLANLGNISATWRSYSFMFVPFTVQNALNARLGGVAETATAAGAAFTHSCILHASYVGDGNVFDVTDDDQVYITVDLSGVTGVIVASGTLELFGIPSLGAQAYLPKLATIQANASASGIDLFKLPSENIAKVFLHTLTNVDSVQIIKDRQVYVQGAIADLLAISNYRDRVETAVTTNVLLDLQDSGLFDESLSDDVEVEITAGAGGAATPYVTSISYDATPDVLQRSRARVDSTISAVYSRKVQNGKTRSVNTAKAIQGR